MPEVIDQPGADEARAARKAIQTYIFDKGRFGTADEVAAWCDRQDPKVPHPKIDETEDSYRVRQFDPADCAAGSYATFDITEGVRAVLCAPSEARSAEAPPAAPAPETTPESPPPPAPEPEPKPGDGEGPPLEEGRTFMLPVRSRTLATSTTPEPAGDGGRRYRMTISTEAPVPTDDYPGGPAYEVLAHTPAAIDMSLMRPSAPLHDGHEVSARGYSHGPQVGVVEDTGLEGRSMAAYARFSRSARGQDAERDVADRIKRFVSIGYRVLKARRLPDTHDGLPVWEAVRWQPFEVSLVGMPADRNAIVVRAAERPSMEVQIVGEEPGTEGGGDRLVGARAARKEEGGKMKKVRDTNGAIIEVEDTDPREAVRDGAPGQDQRSKTQAQRDKETAQIFELCDEHGMGGAAPEFVRQGLTIEQVSHEILTRRRTPAPDMAARAAEGAAGLDLGLRTTDQRRFSYARSVLIAAGEIPNDGIEAEINQELKRKLGASGLPFRGNGVLVPYDLRTRQQRYDDSERRARALASQGATGSELVFDTPGELIELLRNRTVAIMMGARVLSGLSGPIPFPAQDAAGVASWVGENPGADLADSDLGLGLRTLQPKTLQSSTSYSRQLLIQASLDVENLVRNDLGAISGIAIDRAFFHGQSAAGQPAGIYSAFLNSQDHSSTVPTYAGLVNQAALVADDNAAQGAMGWVTTPLMAGKLKTVPEHTTASMAGWIWQGTFLDGTLAGYRGAATNQISKTMTGTAGADTGGNDHGIVFGNFSDAIIGFFGALEIVVDPYAKKKRGLIEVTSFQMADILFRHLESFSVAVQARIA